jgi:hypothetical protein
MPGKTNEGKIKNSERNHHNSNGRRSGTRQGNTSQGGRGGRGSGRGGRGGRGNNDSEHLKNVVCFNCGKKATILLTDQFQEKITMNSQTWYPSRISKTYFNLH